jgi:uncharacterized protein (DUF2267 family)
MDGENRERVQIETVSLISMGEFEPGREQLLETVEPEEIKITQNYLRSVENSIEQNDNSLDGIINNLPDAPNNATKREEEEIKLSVVEELRTKPPVTPQEVAQETRNVTKDEVRI